MLVDQVFEAWLFPDPLTALNSEYDEGENITEGILNVDITSGTDIYEGPQQQIDTGQFTIVTRNPAMDPKINPNLKYNATIKFYDTRSGEFFRGYVTDIQVEYQRDDNPIITITGTDIFGAMQRVVVDQETHDAIMALSTGPTWNGLTFTEFLPYMLNFTSKYLDINSTQPPGYPTNYGFWFPSTGTFGQQTIGQLGYSPAKYIPQVGETYLEVINKYAQTNLTSFTSRGEWGYWFINVYPFPKYDPNYWSPQSDPMLTYTTYDFSSDPADDRSYRSILIDNGYNRVINQVDISNESRYVDTGELKSTTENFVRSSQESIEEYAVSKASVSTIFPEEDALPIPTWATRYSDTIFQVVKFPGQEIQQITFDNARAQMIEDGFSYSDYNIDKIIRIKHQINDTQTIDRIYDIAGISHNITPDDWSMTFTLKPSKQELAFIYQGSLPKITMNSLVGDSNFNFTATITDIDPSTIFNVYWALSATDSDEIINIYPYARTGNMFKDGEPRIGNTQTWNFDDDGILAPYSFDPDSTFDNPLDNRYGGYGVGNWYIYAYIRLNNGYFIVIQEQVTVGVPEVEADFGWSQNLVNNFGQVSFTDTSVNHETEEPDAYLWDFGDGTTSTQRNPVKVYDPAPGQTEYEVSLTVYAYGEGGAKVYSTHTETITLVQPVMTANFVYTITDSTVQFINTSTNLGFAEPDAYYWDFDDGTTSTSPTPVKTYTGTQGQSMTFDVTLTIRNIWEQTASVTKSITVTPAFTTGSFPVQFIRLRPATGITQTAGTRFTPYMYFFKGLSTNGNTNLMYLRTGELQASAGQTWTNAAGGTVLSTGAFSGETFTQNLTRDPSITTPANYGLSGAATQNYSAGGIPWQIRYNWGAGGNADYTLGDWSLNLRDVTVGATTQWQTVYLDVFYSGYGWHQIGFFPLGKGPVGKNNTLGAASITEATRTLVKEKVLPLNIFNFTYKFNNNSYTATFTPIVNGPYLWTFPGGVTSTATNPTFTFPDRGEHYVTLQAAGGTITEKINVLPVFPYNFRYIRIKQKLHDGAHQWDTPFIANLKVQTEAGSYVSTPGLTNPQSICSKRITQGTAWSPSYTGATTFDPLNTQNLTNDTGLRFQTQNAGNTSEWDVVIDYKEAVATRIHDITLDAAVPVVSGSPVTIGAGITYEIFTTNYTGTFASATDPDNIGGGATWTKLGEIKPDSMFQNKLKTFSLIPE